MSVLAIDPGPTQSAWVHYGPGEDDSTSTPTILDKGIADNRSVLAICESAYEDEYECLQHVVIEKVESFGMAVGASVFETVYWTGRFIQAWGDDKTSSCIGRRDVKLCLCGSARAKDANIRQALIDRFGGSKEAAIGLKKSPGPLYGVKSHEWAALALAVTWEETR